MAVKLSNHFTYRRLFKFVVPSVFMMIFTSIYSVADGFFVSNFAGKTDFAAVNIVMPLLMGMGSIGFMIGTGGSAVVSKTLGEGNKEKANEYFSLLVFTAIVLSILFSAAAIAFIEPIVVLLGAEGDLIEPCITYAKILIFFQTAFILQNVFQPFFVAAEKPALSLIISIAAGVTNFILDFVLIVVFDFGIVGAAAATVMGQIIGGIVPIIYFSGKNKSILSFKKFDIDLKVVFKACGNGVSELLTNVSASLVSAMYNIQLMKIAGENGVAAYGVIMYVNFVFSAVFIGYSIGTAPIIGYHYGADNSSELKNIFKKSIFLISIASALMTAAAELTAMPIASVFVGYDEELKKMTSEGFMIYSLSFLVMGFNIFGSAFFTALNNGLISGMLSFLRTFVFQISAVFILPIFFRLNGIWAAVIAAELMAAVAAAFFFIYGRKKYKY